MDYDMQGCGQQVVAVARADLVGIVFLTRACGSIAAFGGDIFAQRMNQAAAQLLKAGLMRRAGCNHLRFGAL